MIYQKSSADLITKVTKKHSSSFDQEHLENTDSQATSPPPPPLPLLFPLRSWVDLHRVCFCLQPTLFILNFGQFLVPGTFHLRRCSLASRLVIRFKSLKIILTGKANVRARRHAHCSFSLTLTGCSKGSTNIWSTFSCGSDRYAVTQQLVDNPFPSTDIRHSPTPSSSVARQSSNHAMKHAWPFPLGGALVVKLPKGS